MAFGRELSSWDMVIDGFRFVRDNPQDFVRAAALPIVGFAACEGIASAVGGGWVGIALDLVSQAFSAILAVKWHRFYLLGREAAAPRWALAFGAREIRFFLYLAVGSLIMSGLTYTFESRLVGFDPVVFISLVVGAVAVATFVVCRFILVLPAAAVGMFGGIIDDLAGSWRCMKGATFKLFSALFILGLATMVAMALILFIAGSLPLPEVLSTLVLVLILALVGIAVEGIGITIISITFDRRTSWRDSGVVPVSA